MDVETTWRRIETWLEVNAPDVASGLGPGATDEQIAAAERTLGVTLPDDVRASYRRHDGQQTDASLGIAVGGGFTYGGDFLSLEGILDQWTVWKDLLDSDTFEGIQSDPQPGIKPDWWNAKWIPITHDGSGNHLCLDMDPAPGGSEGQIITMWHDGGEREVMAASFTDWLTQLADEYERGEWVYSEGDGGVVRVEDVGEYE
jgi:cell wall assembly regulator SMI1